MSEERTRILQLVQEGKLTVEQADVLISELERRSTRDPLFKRPLSGFDKPKLDDLKQIGTQVSTAVVQSLGEVRRQLEQQFESWNIGPGGSTLSAGAELSLPETIRTLSVESRTGRIQVTSWNQPTVRIHVRGQVKTDSLNEAKHLLEAALQTQQTEDSYQLIVTPGQKDVVMGANIDIYVPRKFSKVLCKTRNGSVHADRVEADEVLLDSDNGNVWVHEVAVERLRLIVENGSIEVQNSIGPTCRTVYASTRNGRIMIDGIAKDIHCVGTAKTVTGKIQITGEGLSTEYEESTRPNHARFEQQPATSVDTDEPEANKLETNALEPNEHDTHIYCETRNGAIRVRA